MNIIDDFDIESLIINFLESKGIIKACLLFKLEKWMIEHYSKRYKFTRKDINKSIISLLKKKRINIIILPIFKITWRVKELNHLKYLEDGTYLTRVIKTKMNSLEQKDFSSRKIDTNNDYKINKLIQNFLELRGEKRRKIILTLSTNNNSLDIFDNFKENFYIKTSNNHIPFCEKIKNKIKIPLKEQENYQLIIYKYRKKYMCFYVTIIEAIQNILFYLTSQKKKPSNYKMKISDFTTKFAFYCDSFVNSDWIDLKPNSYRWESFFKYYNIPISINLLFKNIKFTGRTFELHLKFNYEIKIKKYAKLTIQNLKRFGYSIKKKDMETFSIGYTHNAFIPCSSIEYFYFCGKYFFYYHLFLIFHHSFAYIKKEYPLCKFSRTDKDLYKIFLPIAKLISNFKENQLNRNIIFKYYTKNTEELEIIYNKFLLPYIKPIEKKLYNYFLIRSSFIKNPNNNSIKPIAI
ncbi:MAG: hypothetical protein JXA99_15105 [Candidatus Lokiarchaeota archaeon]|nr:hypothetical protein [Candidatus Lokiarchaeota archaeon]